jgi:hypothetical protein
MLQKCELALDLHSQPRPDARSLLRLGQRARQKLPEIVFQLGV